ncbi:hypothetical protein EGI22_23175 [Lacihabitans sp. LS3-19]|uniref:hypothetical protein n=1 Tax=Lacihabitans sp. LS3-19 TaxID=2487335 RepID=UPI0020CBF9CC|nr:hypothetical protein [Lacihabitans sp. LS3-19]MCP9770817.1 hypothetical protein [Lacihabitans sp. LS3-19]
MIKKPLSVIAGYAVFVIFSVALFRFAGQKPHAEASLYFMILAAICGILYSVLAGFVVNLISKSKSLDMNYFLAAIIAGFAAFSMSKSEGSHWTQILAILIFAPVSILGGYLRLRK